MCDETCSRGFARCGKKTGVAGSRRSSLRKSPAKFPRGHDGDSSLRNEIMSNVALFSAYYARCLATRGFWRWLRLGRFGTLRIAREVGDSVLYRSLLGLATPNCVFGVTCPRCRLFAQVDFRTLWRFLVLSGPRQSFNRHPEGVYQGGQSDRLVPTGVVEIISRGRAPPVLENLNQTTLAYQIGEGVFDRSSDS
jgi:hypothetical protein